MNEYIEEFLRYLELEKGVSAHTLRAYRKDLMDFIAHVKTEPEKIDMLDVRGFIAEQIRKGLNKTTVSRRLSSVRSFFRFLCREGYMKSNPAKLVSSPRLPKKMRL